MCGIFGVIAKENSYEKKQLLELLEDVGRLSQVRGKDSSGLAFRFESKATIEVLRGPVSIDELLKTTAYRSLHSSILFEKKAQTNSAIFAAIGHARLVTNGSQLDDVNNQPVVKDGIVGIHNGIIVNEDELWNNYPNLNREYEIDTEIIYSVFRHHLATYGNSITAIQQTNKELFGTVSTGFFINDREEFLVYTNNGSLYVLSNFKDIFIYGSEKNILARLCAKNKKFFNNSFTLKQVPANNGYLVEFEDFKITGFDLHKNEDVESHKTRSKEYEIKVSNYHPAGHQLHVVVDPGKFTNGIMAHSERKLLEYNIDRISKLRRCTRCILPETFPFIEFDEKGVCNYCRNYNIQKRDNSLYQLEKLVAPHRKKAGQIECIVPFSGGRDSTFALHMLKTELNLNIVTYTYDWGMVTDLARRNIARVCGKLGVENIIVSADIRKKRKYIRANILAWLKRPHLGMVPLFMAGDKSFHYYLIKLQKQLGVTLNIWGENYLENTDFKVGFAGVKPNFNKEVLYKLTLEGQLALFYFLSKQYFTNPSYINASLFDNLKSHFSRSFMFKKDYHNFYQYFKWDEKQIQDLIINEYNWEKSIDTDSTWRIGDGTAAFYNYIYYTVSGFSEFDTFRSNQIREGMLEREEALYRVYSENKPRYESIKWYLEIIGLNFEDVIKSINSINKLY